MSDNGEGKDSLESLDEEFCDSEEGILDEMGKEDGYMGKVDGDKVDEEDEDEEDWKQRIQEIQDGCIDTKNRNGYRYSQVLGLHHHRAAELPVSVRCCSKDFA